MGFQYSCLIIQRIILPIIFIICCLGRPVGTSLVYLLMYFILPFIPIANSSNLNGLVTAYFIILIALSSLILTAHIGLQIAIAVVGPELIQKCSFEEILLRHIGFIRFNDFQVLAIVEWILLDIIFFLTTIIIYVIIKKLVRREGQQSSNVEVGGTSVRGTNNNLVNFQSIIKVAPALCLASLFLTAVFRPSLIGGIYFLVFLFTSTYWAFYKSFGRGFGILMRAVMFILVFHIIAIVSYQTPWAQEYLNNSSLPARLTALEPLALSTCRNDDDIRQLSINSNLNIDSYLSPIMVLLSYYILALTSKCLISKKAFQKRTGAFAQFQKVTKLNRQVSYIRQPANFTKKNSWERVQKLSVSKSPESPDELSERTPLVRKKRASEPKTPKGDVIPLETVGEVPEEQNYVWLDQIWYIFQGIGEFIYQNSYIFTNIIMMAWSIIYHSWLTFVLLIWSNILWMIPNQRKAMLRSSPFIVLYAELLVTAQYIYGMNFEGEIPGTQSIRPDMDNSTRIAIEKEKKYFAQIGFEHPDRMPCLPIIVKTLFTIMFWTTLRQLCKESKDKKRSSALADMVAPLQLTVGAATSDLAPQPEVKKKPKFFDNAGNYLKDLLIKAWIWLLILIIFLCGLIGQTMTGFRIFYMALFLTFVLIFQCSWKVWLKMMYGFWLFLIVYAMATLILIYTYQFDGFTTYWHDYFGISPTLQNDIGLKVYVTKDLFLHLVTPTLILIMTIVQLHYVHKRFVEGLQKQESNKSSVPEPTREAGDFNVSQREPDESKSLTDPSNEKIGKLAKLKKKFSKKKMETFMVKLKHFLKNLQEFSWMFLELHLLKAVFIVAFVVCVAEVCVLHISIVLLCVIALVLKQSAQIVISRIISILVSIFIISKMIYQVDYINHSKLDVQCNNNQTRDVNNTAEWIGLDKIESGTSLMKLLRRYLIYMIFSTLHAVVVFRQFHARKTENTENLQMVVIFPKITRLEAERDLLNLLKYLVNYGYFKFGLELTLIILVGLIGYRQDMYAIFYAFWLCLLINLSRVKCAKAWPFFQGYTGFVLIFQYFQFVGIPPGLCYEYLYENFGQPKILGVWAVLPGPYLGGTARRMLFDFILLLFIARQSRIFKLEAKIKRTNEEFAGGTNEPIIENYDNIDNEKFVNPTHDFTTNVRNWLDIVKNAILLGWFWVTLAVVFLAGTSSASLLSLGYLIGSFAFLWQGSDFYLRPINVILKWWYLLIHYNVAVITIKTVIQLGGCLFYDQLKTGANWFVYLLGVSCLKYNEHQETVEERVELFEEIDTYFGLSWDAICFVFLIFQLRIFKSYYFIHIINDTKADTILASRGAEIIEDLRQKQIEHKHKHEKGVLVKIKMKMEKIRATQRKMFRPIEKQTHLQDAAAPLVRSNSISSCQGSGYHTPIEDQDENKNFASDIQSDLNGLLPVSTPGLQAPSPSSAVMTVSLEGYLEPQRISLGSPPTSDINAPGSDDTFPVFSPISYASPEASTQAHSLIPPPSKNVSSSTQTGTLQTSHHRRKSSINTVSWIEPVEDSSKGKTFKSPSDTEAQSSILRTRSLYRQQLSMPEESMYINQRRRFSNLSWANEESVSVRTTSLRPYSWGPVGNMYYLESLISEGSFPTSHAECKWNENIKTVDRPPEPVLHPQAVRAGDYYMFEDPDEKIELDLLHSAKDYLEDDDKITDTERKISKRKTLFEVLKELEVKKKEELESAKISAESVPTLYLGPKEAKRLPTRSAISDPLPITSKYDLEGQTDRPKTPVKPSSSKIQDGEEEEVEEEEEEGDDKKQEKNVILRILGGTLVSFAIRLHRLSRNYRYVMKILSEEKKMLKETEGFGEGKLIGHVGKWPPSEDEQIDTLNSQTHIDKNIDNKSQISSDESESDIKTNTKENDDYTTLEPSFRLPKLDSDSQRLSPKLGRRTSVVPEIRILAPSLERGLDESAMLEIHSSQEQIDSESDFELEDDGFIARDHHILVEVCIALWYAILSNTDLICYFIVFINQVASASILSLPLPIMSFLWGTLTIPRPSKTFWVTLIAYTQCVVIIKCIFQYKMIWIDHQSLPNEPLAAEKIIGIEQKDNYATYDLILLLVLFFHRFVLKSQGLWKSETRNNEWGSQIFNDDQGQENDEVLPQEPASDAEKEIQLPLDAAENSIADPDDVSLQVAEKNVSGPRVPAVLKIKSTQYLSSITDFFKNLIHKPRLPTDVYACMFLCEFTNFFILLFGFTAFSAQQGDGGVSEYLAENKVPLPFLIMLLLQFCLIIIDRALYLRKALLYKILFHYGSVFGIHIWMFFVIPAVTEARFNHLKPPIIFYIIKCVYLLLSSYQIRCGYPKRILGNFLTKGYSVVNMASFKLYKLTPFLYELRTFLDWVCTETTMTLWDWLKMEDIFSEIYFIKCSRELEETFPVMRATKKPMLGKILVGGTFILVIVIIIWAPLALFALSSAVGYANVPTAIQATLKIGSYEPIYTADVKDNIKIFSKENLTNFLQLYIKDKYAVSFITGYDAEDVATIELPANSATTWEISPPDKERLIEDLIQNRTLTCRFSYSLYRVPPNDKSSDKISGETRFEITPEFPSRKNLIAMLQGQLVEGNVTIPDMLPKFLKVKNNNVVSTINQLQTAKYPEYSPFVLKLNSLNGSGQWWEIRDCLENEDQINSSLPFANCEKMVIYTFSDKKFPSTFSFFTAGGIIGMYTTFVILVSRYLRTGFSGSSHVIQFVDLPYVDRMLQMCLDVYLVKNLGDLNTVVQLTPRDKEYRAISLRLSSKGTEPPSIWWDVTEDCSDSFYNETLSRMPHANCASKLIIYSFSDKKFPSTFSFLTAGGIVGMYTTFVIFASSYVRGAVTGSISKIMFEDLPCVDRVLQLCLDIYLVREALEFALEEDLFAKLIFLYRSPETMIKWTREIEAAPGDDADAGADGDGDADADAEADADGDADVTESEKSIRKEQE